MSANGAIQRLDSSVAPGALRRVTLARRRAEWLAPGAKRGAAGRRRARRNSSTEKSIRVTAHKASVERPKAGQALFERQAPERVRGVMVKAEGRSTAVTRLFSGELFRRGSGAAAKHFAEIASLRALSRFAVPRCGA